MTLGPGARSRPSAPPRAARYVIARRESPPRGGVAALATTRAAASDRRSASLPAARYFLLWPAAFCLASSPCSCAVLDLDRRLGVQPRATRECVRLAAGRAAEVERSGDRLRDDALFEVRVGDRQQRVDARLLAQLRADRELSGDRLVAGSLARPTQLTAQPGTSPEHENVSVSGCARRVGRHAPADPGCPSPESATAAGSR